MEEVNPVEILLVEDNPNDAELTMRALRKQNIANPIFVVEDGEEALEFIYRKGKYSNRNNDVSLKVILLDLKLPKVNGLEVLKELKSNEETKKLPVVVITSSRQDPDIRTAYDLGANSYVVKPVEFEDFLKAMSQIGLYWLVINEPPK